MSRNLTGKYAAITSTVALLVALGGTGSAAGLIGTSDIKDNAVTGPKIKNGAVTGADVREGSLGIVPQAEKANGVQPFDIFFDGDFGDSKTIFDFGTLRIDATCSGAGQVSVVATTTVDEASIYTVVHGDTNPTPANPLESDIEGNGFDVGTNFDLLAGGDGNVNLVQYYYDNPNNIDYSGFFSVDEDGSGCEIHGQAFVS